MYFKPFIIKIYILGNRVATKMKTIPQEGMTMLSLRWYGIIGQHDNFDWLQTKHIR